MNWDWLIKLFPKLKKLNLEFFKNLTFIHIGPKIKYTDKRSLKINFNKLSPKEKKTISNKLPKLLESGVDILEEKFKETADDYKEKIQSASNQKVLEYFKGKIPDNDISILKASLYLKSVFESDGETKLIKSNIVNRYGVRGRHICNLCTAGYFETWIRPAYEEMSQLSGFTLGKFLKVYEEIVEFYPFALFVHGRMSEREIKQSIEEKIKIAKKYGIKTLNIHGIGSSNLKKIRKVIDEIEIEDKFDRRVEKEGNVIVIKLTFKNSS